RPKLSSAKGLASKTEGGAPPPREIKRAAKTFHLQKTEDARKMERAFVSQRTSARGGTGPMPSRGGEACRLSAACWMACLSDVPVAFGVPVAVFAVASAAAGRVFVRAAGAAAVVSVQLAAFCCLPHSSAEPSVAPGSASARCSGAPGPASSGVVPVAADASDRAAGSQSGSGCRRWAWRLADGRYTTYFGHCLQVDYRVDYPAQVGRRCCEPEACSNCFAHWTAIVPRCWDLAAYSNYSERSSVAAPH